MGLIELLNKYQKHIVLEKTALYKSIDLTMLKDQGISYCLKSPNDLFLAEIALNGVKSKLMIEECYNQFVTHNFDTFEYVNYQEKNKMFQVDLGMILDQMVYFKDIVSKTNIYIPYFEPFVNQRYIENYEMLTLKGQHQYLMDYKKDIQNSVTLYGIQPYVSKLSSLYPLGKGDDKVYFYHPEFYTIFVYDLNTGAFVNDIGIVDKYSKKQPDIEEVKDLISMILMDKDENIVEYLLQNEFICEKTYKKISKKLEKRKK